MSSAGSPTAGAKARAIVIGHGGFANGMVAAVQMITGQGDVLLALSVQDLSLAHIEEMLRTQLQQSGIIVVFTDLQAGSATMAARKVLRAMPQVVLVAGANLPMLLDFALNTTMEPPEAARHAADRGRAAIVVHGGPT